MVDWFFGVVLGCFEVFCERILEGIIYERFVSLVVVFVVIIVFVFLLISIYGVMVVDV